MRTTRRQRRLPALVTVVGLALFFALAAGCRLLFNQSENRLLVQRTNEAGATLQISVSQIQSPLNAAAQLAAATGGDPSAFAKIITPYVGTGAAKPFTSAALYQIGTTTPVAQVGAPIALSTDGDNGAQGMFAKASTKPFVITDLLDLTPRRLGYAVSDTLQAPQFVAYGERTLSVDPNVRRRTEEPFSQLDYAIYIGAEPVSDRLLGASLRDLPIRSRSAKAIVDFGDTQLLLVMTPIGHLSGNLFANLWWIVAAGGALVSASFAILIRRLLERSNTALGLAADNERLYSEQRHIAETLQLGLLPEHLDTPAGVAVAARYWPAGSANLIGGDFYDMFAVSGNRWAIAIGDVCGKGIEAAALTGLARHTLRAAARSASSPTEVLLAVHQALREHRPATFCTACFGFMSPLDDGAFRIQLSLGGHPQPLLRHSDGRVESVGTLGMLLGMISPTVSTTVVDVGPGDTLIFFTDGLTDAPAAKAVSVEELAALLEVQGEQPIEQLADSIRALKRGRRPHGSDDDTALLIVRLDAVSPSSAAQTLANEPANSSPTR